VHFVADQPRCLGRNHRVPAPRPRDAVDAGRAEARARLRGKTRGVLGLRLGLGGGRGPPDDVGLGLETALAGEPLVDRLAPEDHRGSISP